jgi:hypothetical protein
MNYWLSRDGLKYGPYTLEVLERMAAEGSVAATDLVWYDGRTNWAPLSEVISMPGPPPPPPPPPSAWARPYAQPAVNPAPVGYGVAAGVLAPPSLHWGLVLLLTFVTLGIFPLIWYFVQAAFVQKIERNSSAIVLGVFGFVAVFFAAAMRNGLTATDASFADQDTAAGQLMLAGILQLAAYILFIVGLFKMRQSMLNYYNLAEPINLRLSGPMTFFFGIFYLQYHFSRIAQWKRTGFLPLQ